VINVVDVDHHIKKLTAYKFLQLFIIAQLNEADSLKDLSKQLKDKEEIQKFIKMDTISSSQLSRKQCGLSSQLFEKVFKQLVFEVQARLTYKPIMRDIGKLLVIDSSTMSMSLSQYPWATFRKTKAGVRLHLRVMVTKDITAPDKAVILPAKHADRSQMDELIEMDSDAIHLFDRGYNDYKQFDKLCKAEVRFVTRIKKNAKIEVILEHAPDEENNIFLDQKVYLGDEQNETKMEKPLRLIKTKDSEGNVIIIITNCFDLSAKEIGDLYRHRWKIETFFKWMKQHLKLKTFYGKSENAVYTQIWIALITYCLQVLLQLECHHEGSLFELNRTLRNLLFSPLDEFIRSLFRQPTRESKGRKKYDWERDFQFIVSQFDDKEVSHLNDLTYDPVFI
jgi:IS4 transposase